MFMRITVVTVRRGAVYELTKLFVKCRETTPTLPNYLYTITLL